MRTVERFAFIFGIVNLVFGVLSLFSPFVTEKRSRNIISRITNRRHSRGLINTREGQLLGVLGAVNPPHTIMHSALGAAGIATRPFSHLSRAYMWLNAILFAALAVIGWTQVGFKPGIHNVRGVALDWRDNILHTVLGGAALLFALRPDLGDRTIADLGGGYTPRISE